MKKSRKKELVKLLDRGFQLQEKIQAVQQKVQKESEELAEIKALLKEFGPDLDENPEEKGSFRFNTESAKMVLSDSRNVEIAPKKLWKYLKARGQQKLFWKMVSVHTSVFEKAFGEDQSKVAGKVSLQKYAVLRITGK